MRTCRFGALSLAARDGGESLRGALAEDRAVRLVFRAQRVALSLSVYLSLVASSVSLSPYSLESDAPLNVPSQSPSVSPTERETKRESVSETEREVFARALRERDPLAVFCVIVVFFSLCVSVCGALCVTAV